MKKHATLLTLFFTLCLTLQAQVVKLDYKYYTSWFSQLKHIPVVVTYTLTHDMLSCTDKIKRTNKFKPDPKHKNITDLAADYKNSGYDRGHNMSAADNECSMEGMTECFYFSNMTPQPHSFNAGVWEELEETERHEAIKHQKLIITCGSLGERFVIGKDKVCVPEKMWKVIYIHSLKKYECYLFPNSDGLQGKPEKYAVPLAEIKKLAKVDFTDGIVKPEF